MTNTKIRFNILVPFFIFVAGISFVYQHGVNRGMDHKIDGAIDVVQGAVSIAISDLGHGLNQGYLTYSAVDETLRRSGFTSHKKYLAPLGVKYYEVPGSPNLLQKAIDNALNVKIDKSKIPKVTTIECCDLGFADYFKISFYLNGFNISSSYKLYFYLLTISVISFFITFIRNPGYLFFGALLIVTTSVIANNSTFWSVVNFRYLSTLGILPIIQITLLILQRRRLTISLFVTTLLQCLILCFVFTIRITVLWMFLYLFLVAIFFIFKEWKKQSKRPSLLIMGRMFWPLGVALICVIVILGRLNISLNQQYAANDYLAHHPVYHNAFIGLAIHPAWMEQFGKLPKYNNMVGKYSGGLTDVLAYNAAFSHFQELLETMNGRPFTKKEVLQRYLSPISKTIKWGLHDKLIRSVYYHFILDNPWFVVESHFHKVLGFFDLSWKLISYWQVAFLSSGLVAVMFIFSFGRQLDRQIYIEFRRATLVAFSLFPISLLPTMWAYPMGHIIYEQMLTAGLLLAAIVTVLGWTVFQAITTPMISLLGKGAMVVSEKAYQVARWTKP